MKTLAAIIGLLDTLSSNLSRKGLTAQAQQIDAQAAALVDLEVESPSYVPDSLGGVIDREIVATSLAVRTAAAKRPTAAEMRQLRRQLALHPPRSKRWLCCSKPAGRTNRKGKFIWGAVCRYKLTSGPKAGSIGGEWILLSTSRSNRPQRASINGKTPPVCKANMERVQPKPSFKQTGPQAEKR